MTASTLTFFFSLQIAHLLSELKTIQNHSEPQKRLVNKLFSLVIVVERSMSLDSRNSLKELITKLLVW